jgi:hypothetical protein
MDHGLSSVTGWYEFDIIAFDEYAHEHWGYTEEEHGSLSDFVKSEFGEEAKDFIGFLIGNRSEDV